MEIKIDADDLRPLIYAVVMETMQQSDGQLGYPEKEAAKMVGMAPHQLRDRRLEGLVQAKQIGRTYYYTRAALAELLKP